jgi:hypothetical protein
MVTELVFPRIVWISAIAAAAVTKDEKKLAFVQAAMRVVMWRTFELRGRSRGSFIWRGEL